MRYIVDRIEGDIAVCEDDNNELVDISLDRLPEGVSSGDILTEEKGIFTVDMSATEKRRAEIAALQNKLWG